MDYNCGQDFVLEDYIGKNSSRPTKKKTYDCDETSTEQEIEQEKTSYLSAKFTCRFCTKTYKHKRTLTAHEKVHLSEQNFVCQLCNKTFMHNKSLLRHKKAHSQEQKFSCQVCAI